MPLYQIFHRFYPYDLFLNLEGRSAVENILRTFGVLKANIIDFSKSNVKVQDIQASDHFVDVSIEYNVNHSSVVKVL